MASSKCRGSFDKLIKVPRKFGQAHQSGKEFLNSVNPANPGKRKNPRNEQNIGKTNKNEKANATTADVEWTGDDGVDGPR